MALTCTLKPEGGRMTNLRNAEVRYLIYDPASPGTAITETAALAILLSTAPSTLGNQVLTYPRVEGNGDLANSFIGIAAYMDPDLAPMGKIGSVAIDGQVYEFGIREITKHVVTSISTRQFHGDRETTIMGATYDNAINVTDEGVQGVDVPNGTNFRFGIATAKAAGLVTNAYLAGLAAAVGTLNTATFCGFAAGSVRFVGAEGHQRGDGSYAVQFQFEVDLAGEWVSIATFDIATRAPFEYVWVRYVEGPPTNGVRTRRAECVMFEKVYRTGAWTSATLGVGTT
jgi:hypothetical protein